MGGVTRVWPAMLFMTLVIGFSIGCDDAFQYHPWQTEVPADETDLNNRSIQQIQQILTGNELEFQFAIVSDPHYFYDELYNQLQYIKSDGSMAFIIVAGDLTDQGLSHEFLWYNDVMEESALPYISVIGNHDHLGNGRVVFEKMFGSRNHVFEAGGVRFILFDNVVFESVRTVDFTWLDQQLTVPFSGPTLVFMHIQPTDVQMEGEPGARLDNIMQTHQPTAVFMGHLHSYASDVFPGGTPWATAPWPENDGFLKVHVNGNTITHQLIQFED